VLSKEIGRAQMVVALLFLGIHAGGLNSNGDPRSGGIGIVQIHGSTPFVKVAFDFGNHQMPHGKREAGMYGVEVPFVDRHTDSILNILKGG
jgi:hypothetical protein